MTGSDAHGERFRDGRSAPMHNGGERSEDGLSSPMQRGGEPDSRRAGLIEPMQRGDSTVAPTVAHEVPAPDPHNLTATPPAQWMQRIPGNIERLQRLAHTLAGTASTIDEQRTRLKAVSVDTFWSGQAATAFTEYKKQLPPPLHLAQQRYHRTAHALHTYVRAMHDIKQTARRAISEATESAHAIEAHGHHVSEWRLYAGDGPVALPPRRYPGPIPVMRPDGKHPAYPGGAEQILPAGTEQVVSAGTEQVSSAAAERGVSAAAVRPAQPADMRGPWPQPIPQGLRAEFERFGASVKLMHSAIDLYEEAAARCAAAIRQAVHDELRNTAGYHKDLAALKDAMHGNLAAIAPALQSQLGKITGVASLLGWLPVIAAFAGTSPQTRQTLKELTKQAAAWRSAHGDGKKIVDGFLDLLTDHTRRAATQALTVAPGLQPAGTEHGQDGFAEATQKFQQGLTDSAEQFQQGLTDSAEQFQQGLTRVVTHTVPVPA